MNTIKINKKADVVGTSRVGELYVSYQTLVDMFGEPETKDIDPYKIDAEWVLETPIGVATIYNYKNGKNYLGDEGLSLEKIEDWHIGGHKKEVAHVVRAYIGGFKAGHGEYTNE